VDGAAAGVAVSRPARDFKAKLRRFRAWVRLRVPPGFRLLLGLLLIVFGIFGFLPILGFWMLPLGVVVAALDVGWIRKTWARLRGKDR
jgi:hypothetical protein